MYSAPGPGMEILCFGTPDAVKKVYIFFIWLLLSNDNQKHLKIKRNCFLFSDGFYKPTNQIKGAHNKAEQNPSTKAKKRRGSARGMAPSVVSVPVAHNRAQLRFLFKPALCALFFFWFVCFCYRTASRA